MIHVHSFYLYISSWKKGETIVEKLRKRKENNLVANKTRNWTEILSTFIAVL